MTGRGIVAALALAVVVGSAAAQEQTPVAPPGSMPPDAAEPAPQTKPTVEPLGGDRYRIGEITIDKGAGTFTVPGVALDLGDPRAPIEFIATARGGTKNYESLIEVAANAYEFNLACILIGLTPRPDIQPTGHFDPNPIDGSPLAIRVSWTRNGETIQQPAGRLLSAGEGVRIVDAWCTQARSSTPTAPIAPMSPGRWWASSTIGTASSITGRDWRSATMEMSRPAPGPHRNPEHR